MAGRERNRLGLDKPRCAAMVGAQQCKSIPPSNWRYCPHHHSRELLRLLAEWREAFEDGAMVGTSASIRLPDLNKPLDECTREERAALAMLLLEQNRGLQLPEPTS